jgi:hypothetical protein
MFRRTVAASLLGLAVVTAGATAAHAQSAVGVLDCTDQFVDDLLVHKYLSCVA